MEIKQFLDEIKSRNRLTKDKIIVGRLDDNVIKFLGKKGVEINTKDIYLNHKGLSHLARESKKQRGAGLTEHDIIRIPDILKNPSAIFFDNEKTKLNLLYCINKKSCKRVIKLVIDTKYRRKKESMTLIKTAGYVEVANLKQYEVVKGNIESR